MCQREVSDKCTSGRAWASLPPNELKVNQSALVQNRPSKRQGMASSGSRLARTQRVITWLHTVSLSLLQRLCAPQVVLEPCFLFRAECRWASTAPRLPHAPHVAAHANGRLASFLQGRCNREVYPSRPPLHSLAEQMPMPAPRPLTMPNQPEGFPTPCSQLWRSPAAFGCVL